MSRATQMWEATKVGRATSERASVRTLVEEQLSDTRILVDELYQRFADSGTRSKIDRLIQDRSKNPWHLTDHDSS